MRRLEFIKELIKLFEQSSINELEVIDGKRRVRILRDGNTQPVTVVREQSDAANIAEESTESNESPTIISEITSPMVGIFLRAASMSAPPFVAVGHVVHRGENLCSIVAMNLPTPIQSEGDFIIREILVEDGVPVEFGQPMFLVEELAINE